MKYLFRARRRGNELRREHRANCARYDDAQVAARYFAKTWSCPVEIWADRASAKFPMETIEYTPERG